MRNIEAFTSSRSGIKEFLHHVAVLGGGGVIIIFLSEKRGLKTRLSCPDCVKTL